MDKRKLQATLPKLCNSAMSKIFLCWTFLVLIKSAIYSKEVKIFLVSISKNFICLKIKIEWALLFQVLALVGALMS